MSRPKVTLRAAFEWTCDNCGRDHYGKPSVESAYRIQEMIRNGELAPIDPSYADEFVPDQWLVMPPEVKCKYCGSVFLTESQKPHPDLNNL